ncbi:MAG: hypothetical protein WD971_04185 [Pirellulales bacterium]
MERWKVDFALLGDGSPKYFHCPILLTDKNVELCMGHVVNKAIPNCCRKTVLQRKDIDGFYGSLLERHFATAIKAKDIDRSSLIFDREIRRDIPWKVLVAGKEVDAYEPTKHKSPTHPTVEIQDPNGKVLNLVLKLSDRELSTAKSLQVRLERSYVPEVTASLLKSAHLTMFAVFGYRHVYSPAGLMVADILRSFFIDNVGRQRKVQSEAALAYFPKHAGMVIPLGGYDTKILRGSIEDRRFIVCVGSSGRFYALGVFVRTDASMHIVLLPPDEADHMDTYFELIKDH